MKRAFVGVSKKLTRLKLHRGLRFAIIVVILAVAGVLMMPHGAKANPVAPINPKWISRAVITSDNGQIFIDSNTYDTTYEYVERNGGTCPNRISFSPAAARFSSDGERNIYFFYETNSQYYNQHVSAIMYNGTPQTLASGNASQCNYTTDTVTQVANKNSRRYTWWRNSIQGDGNTITNIITGVTFSRKTDFNGVNRFFRDSELSDTNNVCPDMLLLHKAHPTGSAKDVFKNGSSDLNESSILFSVQRNDDLARTSEDYNIDSEPNGDRVGPGTCHVRSQALNKSSNGDMPQFSGNTDNDQYFFTSGLDDKGVTNPSSDHDDDAFVTFIGNEDNLPKNADGTTDKTSTNTATGSDGEDKTNTQVCKGGALGWVLCPIVSAIQTTVDLIRSGMEYMLTVQPFKIDANDPVYIIWDNLRNVANVLYVFAFFLIIFSQATSIGISNLGVKRMLPRLVLFVILSNISYYICVVAVDFFNILGVGVYNLVAIANGGSAGTVDISTSVGLAGIASAGLAAGGLATLIYTGAIVELFPLLVTAFIAILVTFVVLVIRQMIIIGLVAASAIIVTLGLFDEGIPKKAINMGLTLLVMFPMIVGLFAVARLASAVLTQAAANTTAGAFVGVAALLLQVAVGVTAIFLFKMAIVAKGALGKVAGAITDRTKGLTNRAREAGQNTQFYQRRQLAREARSQERRRGAVANYAETISPGANASRVARARAALLRRRAAGGITSQVFGTNQAGQARVLHAAEDIQRKQRQEEAQRALQRMNAMGIEGDTDLMRIATGAGIGADGVFRQTRGAVDANGNPEYYMHTNADGSTERRQRERYTGIAMQIGEAERQAAINSLVAQGRASPLRNIEATGGERGIGGIPNPNNPLHRMLDEAYSAIPNKLGDKSPDLLPNRRATQGVAAFTDLQPSDVAGWHHSTVAAAERFYDQTNRNADRDQTLRAFAEAAGTPSTLAKLSPEQVAGFRNMMMRYQASGGNVSNTVSNAINDAYERKGGHRTDPIAAMPAEPHTPNSPNAGDIWPR